MNFRIPSLLAAALGASALFVTSCVGPDGAYVSSGGGYGPSRTYSNYSVTLGDGYAGRGYYYGPPNTRYYSRQPGVVYYRTRESVPSHYWGRSSTPVRVTTSSSSYRPGYRPPSFRDDDRRDGDRWDNDRRDGDRWDRDRHDDDDDDDGRRGPPGRR